MLTKTNENKFPQEESVWLSRWSGCFRKRLEYKVTPAASEAAAASQRRRMWPSRSERRHAVHVKARPPRAAVVVVAVVHLRAVAELVRALRGLVGITVANLLVLPFLFDAGLRNTHTQHTHTPCNQAEWPHGHVITSNHSWALKDTYKAWGGDCVALLSLWYPDPLARTPCICSWRTWGREWNGMLPMKAGL